MSIAEKLVTIAENTPKVCDAVNAAKTEVNGVVVVANDVSTIEHPVEVKLSSETLADFSGVTVKQNGKNQVDYREWSPVVINHMSAEWEQTNTSVIAKGAQDRTLQSSSGELYLMFLNCPVSSVNKTVTISYYVTLLEQGAFDNRIGLYSYAADKSRLNTRIDVAIPLNERVKVSYTVTPSADIAGVGLRLNNNKVKVEMDTLQIEYSYEATEFEAYKEPTTYTANADGTVDGVMSLAPSMTLVSSDSEATINCRYFPVEAVGVRTAYAELVDAETALRDRLRQRGGE